MNRDRVALRCSRVITGPARTFEGNWTIYHCIDLTGYRLAALERSAETEQPEVIAENDDE